MFMDIANYIKSQSFVVLRIKKFLENPTHYLEKYHKIYILGEPEVSLELRNLTRIYTDTENKNIAEEYMKKVLKVKSKSDINKGRIVYIPGYVDMCIYTKSMYGLDLESDQGEIYTIYDELDKCEQTEDYLDWIEEQKIQVIVSYFGIKYCIAPTFFDYRFYKKYKDFSLKNYIIVKEKQEGFDSIINNIFGHKRYNYDVDISDIIPLLGHFSIVGVRRNTITEENEPISRIFGKRGFPRIIFNIYDNTVFTNGHFVIDKLSVEKIIKFITGREPDTPLVPPEYQLKPTLSQEKDEHSDRKTQQSETPINNDQSEDNKPPSCTFSFQEPSPELLEEPLPPSESPPQIHR